MPEYRFYSIRKDGHIDGRPVDLDLPDDGSAIKEARRLQNGQDIEVWQGPRVVGYVVPDKKAG
jgi:hypothetical protein